MKHVMILQNEPDPVLYLGCVNTLRRGSARGTLLQSACSPHFAPKHAHCFIGSRRRTERAALSASAEAATHEVTQPSCLLWLRSLMLRIL